MLSLHNGYIVYSLHMSTIVTIDLKVGHTMSKNFSSDNIRIYGEPPYSVAVVHGGPGAAGEMAPVAEQLSICCGVIEPLQTADSVEAQIEELHYLLLNSGTPPLTLIGHSWGAWLAGLTAARYPQLVKKLILVSSGAFEEEYVQNLMDIRLSRLSPEQQEEAHRIMASMATSDNCDNALLKRFGELMCIADTYDAIEDKPPVVDCKLDIFNKVWTQAHQMRKDGTLLSAFRNIRCPVIAIHGDYDSTPVDGVRIPLLETIPDAKIHVLEKCGHSPWIERYAREQIFRRLFVEIE